MPLDILIVIVITSFAQSIFGVGVLLFGTPMLLALGYDFISAIFVLLPISITINLIQITSDFKSIDLSFYRKMLLYTIPFVVIFLFIVTRIDININIIVGLFLLIVATKDLSIRIKKISEALIRHERSFLVVMGTVHGLTNLGGSILTALIHDRDYGKDVTRATVAASYATFAVFQVMTLLLSGSRLDIRLPQLGLLLFVGVAIFIVTEMKVYREINNEKYSRLFAVFLFVSGLFLCLRAVWL